MMQGISGFDPDWDGAPEVVLGKTKSSLTGRYKQTRDALQEPLFSGHFSPPSYSLAWHLLWRSCYTDFLLLEENDCVCYKTLC